MSKNDAAIADMYQVSILNPTVYTAQTKMVKMSVKLWFEILRPILQSYNIAKVFKNIEKNLRNW